MLGKATAIGLVALLIAVMWQRLISLLHYHDDKHFVPFKAAIPVHPIIDGTYDIAISVWANVNAETKFIARFSSKSIQLNETKTENWNISLSRDVVQELIGNSESSLFAYITISPTNKGFYPPALKLHSWTLDSFVDGIKDLNPERKTAWENLTPFQQLVEQSSIRVPLLLRPRKPRGIKFDIRRKNEHEEPVWGRGAGLESLKIQQHLGDDEVEYLSPKLVSQTWLSFPTDQPVYDKNQLQQSLWGISTVNNNCNNRQEMRLPIDHLPCARTFLSRGHGEHFLEFGSHKEGSATKFKYPPYFVANPASPAPGLIDLDTQDIAELRFTWRVQIGAVSPLKMLIAESLKETLTGLYSNSPYDALFNKSAYLFINSLFGYPMNTNSVLFFALIISNICATMLTAHYWMNVTSGASITSTSASISSLSSSFLALYLVQSEGLSLSRIIFFLISGIQLWKIFRLCPKRFILDEILVLGSVLGLIYWQKDYHLIQQLTNPCINPLLSLYTLVQCWHNIQSRRFSGSYRVTAVFWLISASCNMFFVDGRFRWWTRGLWLVHALFSWQALTCKDCKK